MVIGKGRLRQIPGGSEFTFLTCHTLPFRSQLHRLPVTGTVGAPSATRIPHPTAHLWRDAIRGLSTCERKPEVAFPACP